MKRCVVLLGLLLLSSVSFATPLTMNYSVTELSGGIYHYSFSLVLDNHDGSWVSGDAFNWIIFGDDPVTSPLKNWVGDSSFLPIGPFTYYGSSGGDHNGPTIVDTTVTTLSAPVNSWVPASIGDELIWAGTSTANLGQGALLWSNLWNQYGSVAHDPAGYSDNRANFAVANCLTCSLPPTGGSTVPEPSSIILVAAGLLGGVPVLKRAFRISAH